jgi:hypothetical protein
VTPLLLPLLGPPAAAAGASYVPLSYHPFLLRLHEQQLLAGGAVSPLGLSIAPEPSSLLSLPHFRVTFISLLFKVAEHVANVVFCGNTNSEEGF